MITEKEAKAQVEHEAGAEIPWFCPLVKGKCRRDFVSFQKARAFPIANLIGTNTDFGWGFIGAACRFFSRAIGDK